MMTNDDDDDDDDDVDDDNDYYYFRYLEQRRIDALKRIEVSKQRKTLYDLIASDKITAIFNARANNNAGGDDDDGCCGDGDDWLCHLTYSCIIYLFIYLCN